MKKVSYNLNFGLLYLNESKIGSKSQIFIDYLDNIAIKSNDRDKEVIERWQFEFIIVFEDVPIKLKLFMAKNLDEVIYHYDEIKNLDVIILIFDYRNLDALDILNPKDFHEFKSCYAFRGISVLAGIDVENEKSKEELETIRLKLIDKAKELNVLYGYEISDKNKDISGLFEKIFKDFIFKFQYTSPELFDLAKLYGKELMEN